MSKKHLGLVGPSKKVLESTANRINKEAVPRKRSGKLEFTYADVLKLRGEMENRKMGIGLYEATNLAVKHALYATGETDRGKINGIKK